MGKELTTKTTSQLKVYTDAGLMGAAANISASDVQVPCLILAQSNSEFVQDRNSNIKAGDFVHSITKEVYGSTDEKPVSLVVFDMFKTMIVSDVTGGGKKWLETKEWSEEMELEPYEEIFEGRTIRKEKCFNFCCFKSLDVREVKKPDGSTGYAASPIIVKFKGGSLKNGKRLNQLFVDYLQFGAPSWASEILLKAKLEEKDGSKYWAYDFEQGEQTMEAQQHAAAHLFKQLQRARQNNELNVVDSEEKPVEKKVKNYAEDIC